LGDYSFFIKSASFLIILNAAIFTFPEGIETITGGNLNTSEIQGTNVSLQQPQLGVTSNNNGDDVINLGRPVDAQSVNQTPKGFVIPQKGASNAFVTYNLSKFDKNSDGLRDVFFDVDSLTGLLGGTLKLELDIATGSGVKTINDSLKNPDVVEDIAGTNATFYFGTENAKIRSIEDSVGIKHSDDRPALQQLASDVGAENFARSIDNLVSLYTTPSTGNQVLGAIFTLYLLGFTVFLLKEVVPG
jgi:hypothetical protein